MSVGERAWSHVSKVERMVGCRLSVIGRGKLSHWLQDQTVLVLPFVSVGGDPFWSQRSGAKVIYSRFALWSFELLCQKHKLLVAEMPDVMCRTVLSRIVFPRVASIESGKTYWSMDRICSAQCSCQIWIMCVVLSGLRIDIMPSSRSHRFRRLR